MNTKTLTVLDFTLGEVHIYLYPADWEDEIEHWIQQNTEHRLSNIHYMCTDNLILKTHFDGK